MFKKSVLLGLSALLTASILSIPMTSVNAAEQPQTNTEDQIQPRTLIVTAKGKLSGSMVPYYDKTNIEGFNTGYLDLHYHSSDTGFVDGDNSYLTIELPPEFATIAKQACFKENISGRVQRKGLFGDKWFNYSPDDIKISGTQISFKTPKEFWIFNGEVNADISINYGNVQQNYPIRLIPNNPAGYQVQAALRRSMAPWDPLQNPILGTNSSIWNSAYTNAYWD